MTRLDSPGARRPVRVRDAAIVGLLLLVPALVVTCVLFGLGLATAAPPAASFAVAIVLTVLPVAGLGAGLRGLGSGGNGAGVVAAWLWAAAVLIALPAFAPGERRVAAERGADTLFAALPAPLSAPLTSAIGTLASLPGAEGEPRPAGAPIEAPLVADRTAAPDAPPEGRREPARAERPSDTAHSPSRERAPVVLAYRGDGRELDVEVGLDGPDLGEPFRMIFDTGASFTTVTPDALDRIDVRVPADAPRVTLNTAGGAIEAPLVLLDAVWMGDQPVEWVTVAACPSCTAPGRAGLLGLNVSSQFRVEIDSARKRIHLDPAPGDRTRDVRPWVQLRAEGRQHADGRLEIEVTLGNRAPRAIESATVEIDCGTSGFAIEVADVPARGERSSAIEVPGATRCESFQLDLIGARWRLDRF